MKNETHDPTDQEVIDKMLESRLTSLDPRWTDILDQTIQLYSTDMEHDQHRTLAWRILNQMDEYKKLSQQEEDEYWEMVKSNKHRFPVWTNKLVKSHKASAAIAINEFITGIEAPPTFRSDRYQEAKKELLRLANRYFK